MGLRVLKTLLILLAAGAVAEAHASEAISNVFACYRWIADWSTARQIHNFSSDEDNPILMTLDRTQDEKELTRGFYIFTGDNVRYFSATSAPQEPSGDGPFQTYHLKFALPAGKAGLSKNFLVSISERPKGNEGVSKGWDFIRYPIVTVGGSGKAKEKNLFEDRKGKETLDENSVDILRKSVQQAIEKQVKQLERKAADPNAPPVIQASDKQLEKARQGLAQVIIAQLRGCTLETKDKALLATAEAGIHKLLSQQDSPVPAPQTPLSERQPGNFEEAVTFGEKPATH